MLQPLLFVMNQKRVPFLVIYFESHLFSTFNYQVLERVQQKDLNLLKVIILAFLRGSLALHKLYHTERPLHPISLPPCPPTCLRPT